MIRSVLIVEPPSPFREALVSALQARGVATLTSDDGLEAIARCDDPAPNAVLVAEQAGAPSASSVCRILERRLPHATILCRADAATTLGQQRTRVLSLALAPSSVADWLTSGPTNASVRFDLGAAQLGALLARLLERRFTGTLMLVHEGHEREIVLAHGMPVLARSTLANERLGALAVRDGLVKPDALESALRVARATGSRLGEALVAQGSLTRSDVFGLLARQARERLAHACAGAPCKAELRAETDLPLSDGPFLRAHPMTALLEAAMQLPHAGLTAALDRADARRVEPGPSQVTGFLAELGMPAAQALFAAPSSGARHLGEARKLVHDSREASTDGPSTDAIVLALLAFDALRLAEPEPARKGVPSMPPPPVGSSLLRVLDARAPLALSEWPSLEPWSGSAEVDRTLGEYLHGSVASERALARAVRGAESEQDSVPAVLREAVARLGQGTSPALLLGVPPHASVAEVEIACASKRAEIDAVNVAETGDPGACTFRKLELVTALERARRLMLNDSVNAPAPTSPPLSMSSTHEPTAAALAAPSAPRAPVLTPLPIAVGDDFPEVERLVQHSKWLELLDLLDRRYPAGKEMPPTLGLLHAVALKEAPPSAERNAQSAQADRLAIRAMSQLLDVAEDSATALVLAKRTLRKRPLEWQKPAARRFSVVLILTALIVGALVGLFVDPNAFSLPW